MLESETLLFQGKLLSWYLEHQRPHPWRQDFSRLGDPYRIWVSEIMLQQTVIKAVLPVYRSFMDEFPTVYDLASAPEEKVRLACRGLGYYRRFANLKKAAALLVEQASLADQRKTQIRWPETMVAWKSLPGVGDYTAAAVGSIAFGWPHAVLDGNVERILCRLYNLQVRLGSPGLKKNLAEKAQKLLNFSAPGDHNQAMMELGQRICTPTSPSCPICPVALHCQAQRAGQSASVPLPKEKIILRPVSLRLFFVRNDLGHVGLSVRSDYAQFLKASLGLPTAIAKGKEWQWDSDPQHAVLPTDEQAVHLGQFTHHITQHKIRVDVYSVLQSLWKGPALSDWQPVEQAERVLLANLDRKALTILLRSELLHTPQIQSIQSRSKPALKAIPLSFPEISS